jgi:hypothetical protein
VPRRALVEMDVCGSMAVTLSTLDIERGARYQAHYLSLALRHGEPRRVSQALAIEAGYLAAQGKHRRAERMADRAESVIEQCGEQAAMPYLLIARGILAMQESAWRAALDAFRRSVAALRQQNRTTGWEPATGEHFGFACRLWLGELGVLAERVPGYVRAAELRGDQHAAINTRLRPGVLLHLWRGDAETADRELESAMAAWNGARRGAQVRHPGAVFSRADLLLYIGDPQRMASHFKADASAVGQSAFARFPVALGELAWALGRVAVARAHLERGSRRASSLEEARAFAALLRQAASPGWLALAHLLDAGVARVGGDDRAARAALEASLVPLDHLSMVGHAAAARRALGRTLGGEGGAALVAGADAHFADEGVADPARWAAVLCPGFAP